MEHSSDGNVSAPMWLKSVLLQYENQKKCMQEAEIYEKIVMVSHKMKELKILGKYICHIYSMATHMRSGFAHFG